MCRPALLAGQCVRFPEISVEYLEHSWLLPPQLSTVIYRMLFVCVCVCLVMKGSVPMKLHIKRLEMGQDFSVELSFGERLQGTY